MDPESDVPREGRRRAGFAREIHVNVFHASTAVSIVTRTARLFAPSRRPERRVIAIVVKRGSTARVRERHVRRFVRLGVCFRVSLSALRRAIRRRATVHAPPQRRRIPPPARRTRPERPFSFASSSSSSSSSFSSSSTSSLRVHTVSSCAVSPHCGRRRRRASRNDRESACANFASAVFPSHSPTTATVRPPASRSESNASDATDAFGGG